MAMASRITTSKRPNSYMLDEKMMDEGAQALCR
jgi:hypothetical protein